jgi:ATP-dependent helicase/nuclease subunit A
MNDDDAVRRRIGPWHPERQPALDDFAPQTNFVVRAAAGSGKTTALVARMVALVRQGVPVGEGAAITFTRKAAGEMNERLFTELRRAERELRGEGKAQQRRRVKRALNELPRCFIGTVHAFCARLLRTHSLAAGLPPRFRAGIEEGDERDLRAEALEQHLQRVHRDDPDALAALSEMGIEPGALGPFFGRLCRFPDLEPYTDGPDAPPDMSAAVEDAAALLEKWQAQRPGALEKGRDPAMKAFDHAERLRAYGPVETPAQQAAFLECFAEADGGVRVTYWGNKGEAPREAADAIKKEHLPHFLEHTARPLLRRWHAFVHRRATAFLTPAVERYRRLRRERGLLTHTDLLLFARDVLRDDPAVRRRVQERFPRLLVDEFQDTDPLQAELLFYLASGDPEETDWRACPPGPAASSSSATTSSRSTAFGVRTRPSSTRSPPAWPTARTGSAST